MTAQPAQRRNALIIVGTCISLLAIFSLTGASLRFRNNLQSWLPEDSPVCQEYRFFSETFGGEELILIGLPLLEEDPLVESIACRLEGRPEFSHCWTPSRLRDQFAANGVSSEQAQSQVEGMLLSDDQSRVGLAAFLSDEGLADRAQGVAAVRDVLDYCQIRREDALIAGAGVVDAELDRLSIAAASDLNLYLTIACGFLASLVLLRDWRLSATIAAQGLCAVTLTLAVLALAAVEGSFLLSALPALTMSLTMMHAVQLLFARRDMEHAARRSFWRMSRPCCLASLMVILGLLSLTISDIGPARQFGVWGAVGAAISLGCALTTTPAISLLLQISPKRDSMLAPTFMKCADLVAGRPLTMTLATLILVAACGFGATLMQSRFHPLGLLPSHSIVSRDAARIEDNLTPVSSVEFIVDFGVEPIAFADKLNQIRQIEAGLASWPEIAHTLSLASFVPPDSSAGAASEILGMNSLDYIATSERFWRISARVKQATATTEADLQHALQGAIAGQQVRMTGSVLMNHQIQHEIAITLGRSLGLAGGGLLFLVILALRSPTRGVVAMLPSAVAVLTICGVLGQSGVALDLGVVLALSIAIGISIPCSLSIVHRYQQQRRVSVDPRYAALAALQSSDSALRASLVAGLGTLPLLWGPFTSTAACGATIAASVLISAILDVVLLPALLCVRPALALRWLVRSTATDVAIAESAAQPWLNGPHVPLAGMKVGKVS